MVYFLLMKALILAKGYGTRLGTLTANLPKPLLKINNKTVLEHIIDNLNLNHINEIIINIHYLPLQIVKILQDRALFAYYPLALSHGESVKKIRYWLNDDMFFVINGDTLSTVNYQDMIQTHKLGTITSLMDRNYRCGGTWIYDVRYFSESNIPIVPYYDDEVRWHDIGTPEKLEIAKKEYEKPIAMS